ncbi:MAG: acetyl-CoA carboxylase biotin carboxylase subunit [Ignavibacteria bacterium]|nr:acetyl-CoA carboxylase biotin carboxylase subunit [Ignavibacteria bacterium]
MFNKILIANRGEVALRIIRTCKEMGIKTVAVYSTADKDSLHVRFADEAVCIGPPSASLSYLSIPKIIAAAEITDADAIHPGYGFLAENAEFAEICADSNIVFIGPTPEMISKMGDKSTAKELMKQMGVPLVEGNEGKLFDYEEARKVADKIGFPLIIKPSSGGGGKGMRIVREHDHLEKAVEIAKSEALAAFGDESFYIEKLIENPRHVEFQIMGDKFGTIVHLGERDCTIQRRHQKLIEESPSPILTEELREKMADAAIKAAQSVNYESVGTVEFLVDKNLDFYFMEMNTRIQVEHPVTEAVSGVDIVKEQIRIAAGERINKKKQKLIGHSIECRINAEDIDNNFQSSPGLITAFNSPGGNGVRVDTHCFAGFNMTPYYDSLIAKVIVLANTREEAITRMLRVLDEFIVEGIKTTIPLHKKIFREKKFIENDYDTNYIEKREEIEV